MSIAVRDFGEFEGKRVSQFTLTSPTGVEVDIIDSSAEKGLGMSPRRMQSACNVVKWGILCVRKCDGSLD